MQNMQTMWMYVPAATTAIPKDGLGNISTLIVASAGIATYTATSVTDTTPWSLAGVAAGNIVITRTGEWGVVTSTAAPTVNVDFWRQTSIGQLGYSRRTPANTTIANIFGSSILANISSSVVHNFSLVTNAAVAFSFRDTADTAGGTALQPRITGQGSTANSFTPTGIEFGDVPNGVIYLGPWSFTTGAGMTATVEFSIFK